MTVFERAWDIVKGVVCDFCGETVDEEYMSAFSEDHGPPKPRWEACHDCVSSGRVVDNDGKEVR